jgi:citrate synthase
MTDTLTIDYGGQQYEIPLMRGTEGERAIDIRKLRTNTGLVTFDPGYGNTGSCESAITYIDGERGILRYRGIPIEQFEDNPNFVEVVWLLIFGHLPTNEYANSAPVEQQCHIDEAMKNNFPVSSIGSPMAILRHDLPCPVFIRVPNWKMTNRRGLPGRSARLHHGRVHLTHTHGVPYIYPTRLSRGNSPHMMFQA